MLTITMLCALLKCQMCAAADSENHEWLVLSDDLGQFQKPVGEWFVAGNACANLHDDHRLTGEAGHGVLMNGRTGGTANLITREQWGDVEISLEFIIPVGSNSGVMLHGVYEIQIVDSWQVTKPTGADCGGVYPRAELERNPPKYYLIDKGIPPLVNAAKAPGQWQSLEIAFRAPRFDKNGRKVSNARFEKVVLNGKLIHENAEVAYPTGHIWRQPEHALGPLLLQGDHGPVAFRNVRVRTPSKTSLCPAATTIPAAANKDSLEPRNTNGR